MKVFFENFEERTVPLANPIITAKGEIRERKVFIIKLSDNSGNFALGEAAPLDGFSRETYAEILEKLKGIKTDFPELAKSDFTTLADFENFLSGIFGNYPTLITAFEQAFVSLALKNSLNEGDEILSYISERLRETDRISTAFLISAKKQNLSEEIRAAVSKGFDTIKIKLTPLSDVSSLSEKLKHFGSEIKFRFDPNGAWNFAKAKKNIEKLSQINCEFIEDPTNNLSENIELARLYGEKIAADFTAANFDKRKRALENGVKTFVIKPSFCGGFVRLFDFINRAKESGARVIISSAFESETGSLWVYFFASLFPETTHGLATNAVGNPKTKAEGKYIFVNFDKLFENE